MAGPVQFEKDFDDFRDVCVFFFFFISPRVDIFLKPCDEFSNYIGQITTETAADDV